MDYVGYVWRAMWKCALNMAIGLAAVVASLVLLQWDAGGSLQQAVGTVNNASATHLEALILLCVSRMPFIGELLDWLQTGKLVFQSSGFELFKDFAQASFLLLTTHYLTYLLQLALVKVQCTTVLDRLFVAIADVIRVGGLCLLTASASLVAYDWFSGLIYDLWGDTVVTNSILFALLILLYIAATFLMGGKRKPFLSKLFSMLLDTALMLCILLYLLIIVYTMLSPASASATAGSLIMAVVLLTLAIPFLLRCKLR